jgi:hypothetical protein
MCPRNSIVSETIRKLSRSKWPRQLRKKAYSQFPFSWFNFFCDMEKPSTRGPTPSHKAHRALRQILNRKPKEPPPLPAKKIARAVDRSANR